MGRKGPPQVCQQLLLTGVDLLQVGGVVLITLYWQNPEVGAAARPGGPGPGVGGFTAYRVRVGGHVPVNCYGKSSGQVLLRVKQRSSIYLWRRVRDVAGPEPER